MNHSVVLHSTRPLSGRHLVAGGLLIGLTATTTPLLLRAASAPDTPAPHLLRAVPHDVPHLRHTPVARALPARASRGGARTVLPPARYEMRTVPVGRTFTGLASWYGGGFQGRRTASGERFDSHDLTAASRTLPFGTRLRVCRVQRCVVVRVNDRGPYVGGRVLDLSRGARAQLGFSGVARVTATPVGMRRVQVHRPETETRAKQRVVTSGAVAPVPLPPVQEVGATSDAGSSAAAALAGVAALGAAGLGLAHRRRRRS